METSSEERKPNRRQERPATTRARLRFEESAGLSDKSLDLSPFTFSDGTTPAFGVAADVG
jgi:hypothetical protein